MKSLLRAKAPNEPQQHQPLVTPTSLSLSLAPPRSPPNESWIHHFHHRCPHDVLRRKHAELGRLLSKTHARHDANGKDDDATTLLRSHQLLARFLHGVARRDERAPRLGAGVKRVCRCGTRSHRHRYRASLPDRVTRVLGSILPLEWQHDFRDSGKFRWVADSLVKLTCPLIAAGRWKELQHFIELSCPPMEMASTPSYSSTDESYLETNTNGIAHDNDKKRAGRRRKWKRELIRYGDHVMQHIDLYWPDVGRETTNNHHPPSKTDRNATRHLHASHDTTDNKIIRGTIVFVHGGAWGSGHPWMYRLVAPAFLEEGFVVAIVGYKTFPDARIVAQDLDSGEDGDSQLCDVKKAWGALQPVMNQVTTLYGDCEGWVGNVLMGHSSGAHVALLMLVDMIGERWKNNSNSNNRDEETAFFYPDLFIGLAGPYDISNHFHFEAGRGVEQISPMKAICGGTHENFVTVSPVSRLMKRISTEAPSRTVQECTPPLLLIHGIEDSTVPFTATADAARALRSCGVVDCEEVYLEKCGHQDVVMHFMIGGTARDLTMKYLLVGWEEKKRRTKNLRTVDRVSRQRIEVKSRL